MIKKFIVFFLFFSVLFAFYHLTIERKSIYKYAENEDYIYYFEEKNSKILNIRMNEGSIKIPKEINSNSTVFLKIKISSGFFGNFFLPEIQINNSVTELSQFLEIGAQGDRYLNISSFIGAKMDSLHFQFNHLQLNHENAELIAFQNPILDQSKFLVVAPHPDDAEIAAFGLYSSFPDTFVLTITAGDGGALKYDELFGSDTILHNFHKGKVRTWNSITVPLLGGIDKNNIINLGYFDNTLKEMYHKRPENITPSYLLNIEPDIFRKLNISSLDSISYSGNNWYALVENLKRILIIVKPENIVAPYPLIDTHPDHKYTTLALFQAIKELEISKGNFFFYTNHYLCENYPFGDSGSIVSLPPDMGRNIYFQALYSFDLDENTQKNKILALDAMNDLRLDTEYRYWDRLLLESAKSLNRKILGKEKDYFRRAVRSNELFYIIPVSDIYDDGKLDLILGGELRKEISENRSLGDKDVQF